VDDTLKKATAFATNAHVGQTRKLRTGGTEPYVQHPTRVAALLGSLGFSERVQVVGVLHDVLEDTDVEWKEIMYRYGNEVAAGVDLMTKGTGPYSNKRYVARLALAPAWVQAVKLADRIDNIQTLVYGPEGWDRGRVDHYIKGAENLIKMADTGEPVLVRLVVLLGSAVNDLKTEMDIDAV